jgi:hypothetical protein
MQPEAANITCAGILVLPTWSSWIHGQQNMSTEPCRWDMPENTSQQDSKTTTDDRFHQTSSASVASFVFMQLSTMEGMA